MIDNDRKREEIIDVLMDLRHDLGKYIVLPVSMLGDDASQQEVRDAVLTAVFETRKKGGATKGAAEIWKEYRLELESLLKREDEMSELSDAVEKALSLGDDAKKGLPRKRADVLKRLEGVSEAIYTMTDRIKGEK